MCPFEYQKVTIFVPAVQPRGIAFVVGGVERHFLFTLAAVDEIRRTGSSEKEVTKQEIKWALDVPAAGDDDR